MPLKKRRKIPVWRLSHNSFSLAYVSSRLLERCRCPCDGRGRLTLHDVTSRASRSAEAAGWDTRRDNASTESGKKKKKHLRASSQRSVYAVVALWLASVATGKRNRAEIRMRHLADRARRCHVVSCVLLSLLLLKKGKLRYAETKTCREVSETTARKTSKQTNKQTNKASPPVAVWHIKV